MQRLYHTPRARYALWILILIANIFLVGGGLVYAESSRLESGSGSEFVWPISGGSFPDLPQSSTYGPRLKASEGFRYDYHQGLDIPAPVGTPILAIMTGTVRIAGSHPLYQDGVVQIDHGNNLYSNYLHISASLVITGQIVGRGEPIALSGVSDSGFAHLHFEIRDGSVWRRDTVHPWDYLPYTDTVRHTVAITEVLAENAVWVQVTTPADELDINQITVTVRSQESGAVVDSRLLNYETRNKDYEGSPALLDNPDLDNILLDPHPFVSTSEIYVVDVKFYLLDGEGPVDIFACAMDVKENQACDMAAGIFDGIYKMHLPVVIR